MNRRTFTASIAALFAAPAMPAAGSLAPVSAAPTAASHYANAKLLARAHNRCSPAMLQRLLRVDSAIATELNGMLLKRGVISTVGAQGVSMATAPLNRYCITNEAMRASNFAQKVKETKAKLDRISETLNAPEQEGASEVRSEPETSRASTHQR
ncbi:hypothetical protein [Planktotalea sp.]|uniref:hypothetical protein n=1 Tax=Planktotalea sp. TaxID=2029877 RepID=UPI0025FB8E44|nr:hypothetical protein [Planktotalea sp.]